MKNTQKTVRRQGIAMLVHNGQKRMIPEYIQHRSEEEIRAWLTQRDDRDARAAEVRDGGAFTSAAQLRVTDGHSRGGLAPLATRATGIEVVDAAMGEYVERWRQMEQLRSDVEEATAAMEPAKQADLEALLQYERMARSDRKGAKEPGDEHERAAQSHLRMLERKLTAARILADETGRAYTAAIKQNLAQIKTDAISALAVEREKMRALLVDLQAGYAQFAEQLQHAFWVKSGPGARGKFSRPADGPFAELAAVIEELMPIEEVEASTSFSADGTTMNEGRTLADWRAERDEIAQRDLERQGRLAQRKRLGRDFDHTDSDGDGPAAA